MQDIDGHLQGGIPAARHRRPGATIGMSARSSRQALFKANRPGYLDLAVDKAAIKSTIYEHPEFAAFIADMNAHFAELAEEERRLAQGTGSRAASPRS